MKMGAEGRPESRRATARFRPDYEIPAERLPEGFVETLAAVPAAPAVPRPAATVVLLREGADGPEALLLRRNRATGFVPGAWVFPGGRVDAADGEDALAERWDGLTREGAAGRLGLERGAEPPAIAYYGAAVREAVEETGLWPGATAGDGSAAAPEGGGGGAVRGGELAAGTLAQAREALLGGGVPLARVLRALNARLDGGAFEYIAHWVTPAAEPRRYDTRFFAASVPAGAAAAHDEREMTGAVWLTPRAALERHRRGGLPMIFPTIRTLEDLSGFAAVGDLLAHYRDRAIPRIQPDIVRTATGVALRVP
ncbi:MAG: NUDIX hydrolase [Gemmatimonadota bacterium]|nr:NUDIX hydrolase [Gemmatimonadota bacterium]